MVDNGLTEDPVCLRHPTPGWDQKRVWHASWGIRTEEDSSDGLL